MAINKKAAAKPSKNVKQATPAKKAVAPKKSIAVKNAKQTVKPAAKKAVAAKPAAKKAAPAKPAAKAPAAKKNVQTKSIASNNNQKTVNKKNVKPAAPAKKAPAAKKAEPAKKAPVKKAAPAPVAKKAAPAPKAVAKPAAKAPAKAAAPAPATKKAAPEVKKAPAMPEPKAPAKKVVTVKQLPVKAAPAPTPRPTPTPAARSIEKKPQVIIAHRKLENKAKEAKESNNVTTQYQPETYRSILDEPVQPQGPVYRYSDEDLAEFKDLITNRLEAARKELSYLQGLITRKDEAGTEDTENRYMNMEDGSGAMEREQLAQLASRQIQFMNHLEKALVRIENKTYGICRVTGKLIDKARLRAVPHATLSIEAKKMMATKQN